MAFLANRILSTKFPLMICLHNFIVKQNLMSKYNLFTRNTYMSVAIISCKAQPLLDHKELVSEDFVHHRDKFFGIQGLERIQMPIHLLWYLVTVLLFLTHFRHLSSQTPDKYSFRRFGTFCEILYLLKFLMSSHHAGCCAKTQQICGSYFVVL